MLSTYAFIVQIRKMTLAMGQREGSIPDWFLDAISLSFV